MYQYCPDKGYIMSAISGNKSTWSKCSAAKIKKTYNDFPCLKNSAKSIIFKNMLPGKKWSATQQCQIYLVLV